MTARPVFQNPAESNLYKRISGKGIQGIIGSVRGGLDGAIDGIISSDISYHPAILVSALDGLERSGKATPELMAKIVQRSRSIDCTPSVRAAEIMLSHGDTSSAAELLSISARSQEIFNRSLTASAIYAAEGDLVNALEAAVRAYGVDPSDDRVYKSLMELDPNGGWAERQNIQKVLSGEKPGNENGRGRMQELFSIYYEWFRGDREKATSALISSGPYREKDPEFMLASARMSVDERDWRSACMVYDSIIGSSPAFVRLEAAEAHLSGGDVDGALEAMSGSDMRSKRSMWLMVRIRERSGDRTEFMDAVRILLESEFSDFNDHISVVRMLMSDGMTEDAGEVLGRLIRIFPRDPRVLSLDSELRASRGDIAGALSQSVKAVRFEPKCNPARLQMARMYLATGKPELASKECDLVIRKDPENIDAIRLMRDIKLVEGDLESAADRGRRILEMDPSDTDARIVLAECLCGSGDVQEAERLLNRAIRDDPGRENGMRVIRSMLSHGMPRQALGVCRELVRTYHDDPSILRLKGNAEYGCGEYMAASVSFASAAGFDPHDPEIWHSKGMADEARGDYGSAEISYDRAILLDMGVPEYWVSKSVIQEHRGDLHGAVGSLNRVIELDPGSVYALVRKAVIVSSASRYGESMHLLDLAEVTSPDDIDVKRARMAIQIDTGHLDDAVVTGESILGMGGTLDDSIRLCTCYLRLGSFSDAVRVADMGLSDHPNDPELSRMRAEAQSSVGQCADDGLFQMEVTDPEGTVLQDPSGEPLFVTSPEPREVTEDPQDVGSVHEDPQSHYEIARSLLAAGEVKGAIRTIDRAIAIDPDNPDYLCLKARAVLESGDREGASVIADSALRIDPRDPDLHEVLGDIRSKGGDHKGALQEYEASIVFGKDSPEVFAKRGDAFLETGDTDHAIESYTIAVARSPKDMDMAERLANMMISKGDLMGAERCISSMSASNPGSARPVVLMAELARVRGDDDAVMSAYEGFRKVQNPGADCTVRMVKVLEDTGHRDEARVLMGGRPATDDNDKAVKRYAEKAMRRAFVTRTPLDDPDVLLSLGLEPSMSRRVTDYLSDIGDYGRIDVGSDVFRNMERQSHDIIKKMDWRNLESDSRLPLEKVFVTGGYRDADDAKRLVAYVFKVMHYDVGRKADPRITEMSMRLPKGMTVFEVMMECDLGVYEAKQVLSQII